MRNEHNPSDRQERKKFEKSPVKVGAALVAALALAACGGKAGAGKENTPTPDQTTTYSSGQTPGETPTPSSTESSQTGELGAEIPISIPEIDTFVVNQEDLQRLMEIEADPDSRYNGPLLRERTEIYTRFVYGQYEDYPEIKIYPRVPDSPEAAEENQSGIRINERGLLSPSVVSFEEGGHDPAELAKRDILFVDTMRNAWINGDEQTDAIVESWADGYFKNPDDRQNFFAGSKWTRESIRSGDPARVEEGREFLNNRGKPAEILLVTDLETQGYDGVNFPTFIYVVRTYSPIREGLPVDGFNIVLYTIGISGDSLDAVSFDKNDAILAKQQGIFDVTLYPEVMDKIDDTWGLY